MPEENGNQAATEPPGSRWLLTALAAVLVVIGALMSWVLFAGLQKRLTAVHADLTSEGARDRAWRLAFIALAAGLLAGVVRSVLKSGALARVPRIMRCVFLAAIAATCLWAAPFSGRITALRNERNDKVITKAEKDALAKLSQDSKALNPNTAWESHEEQWHWMVASAPPDASAWLKGLTGYGQELASAATSLNALREEFTPYSMVEESENGDLADVVRDWLLFEPPRSYFPPPTGVEPPTPPDGPLDGLSDYFKGRDLYLGQQHDEYDQLLDALRGQVAAVAEARAALPEAANWKTIKENLEHFEWYASAVGPAFYGRDMIDKLGQLSATDLEAVGQGFARLVLAAALVPRDDAEVADRWKTALDHVQKLRANELWSKRKEVRELLKETPMLRVEGDLRRAFYRQAAASGGVARTARERYSNALQTLQSDEKAQQAKLVWDACETAHTAMLGQVQALRREKDNRLGMSGMPRASKEAYYLVEAMIQSLEAETGKAPSDDDLYPLPQVAKSAIIPLWTPEGVIRRAGRELGLSPEDRGKWYSLPAAFDTSRESVADSIHADWKIKLGKLLQYDPADPNPEFDPLLTYPPGFPPGAKGISDAEAVAILKGMALKRFAEFFDGLHANFNGSLAAAVSNWDKSSGSINAPYDINGGRQLKKVAAEAIGHANSVRPAGSAQLVANNADNADQAKPHAEEFLDDIKLVRKGFEGGKEGPEKDRTKEITYWWNLYYWGVGDVAGLPNPGEAIDESREAARKQTGNDALSESAFREQADDEKSKVALAAAAWPAAHRARVDYILALRKTHFTEDQIRSLVGKRQGAEDIIQDTRVSDDAPPLRKGDQP